MVKISNVICYSRRHDLAKAAIAASRLTSCPCVGVRFSWCPKASVHIQGEPTGGPVRLEDAAHHDAIGEHVEVVIVPLAGWARGGGALEDKRGQCLAPMLRDCASSPAAPSRFAAASAQ
jgi:hypothetical protein